MKNCVLVVVLILIAIPVSADEFDCAQALRQFISANGRSQPEDKPFFVSRDLANWHEQFLDPLFQDLKQMGPHQRILDLGAGDGEAAEMLRFTREQFDKVLQEAREGVAKNAPGARGRLYHLEAISDYFNRPPEQRPSVTALTAAINRPIPKVDGLDVIVKLFSQASDAELGTYDRIVDLYGALAYTDTLNSDLLRALRLVRPGGKITENWAGLAYTHVLTRRVKGIERGTFESLRKDPKYKFLSRYRFAPTGGDLGDLVLVRPPDPHSAKDAQETSEAYKNLPDLFEHWFDWAQKNSKGINWDHSSLPVLNISVKPGENPSLPNAKLVGFSTEGHPPPPDRFFLPD